MIAGQQQLYRAKVLVDVCVVAALAAVAIAPGHPVTRYVDLLGSVIVAVYLLWNGLRMAQSHLGDGRRLFLRLREHPWTIFWLPIRKDND